MENHPAARASDADRDRVTTALQTAYAEGRLTLHELEQRLTAVHTAETDADLAPILLDLRPATPQAPTATRDAGIIAGFKRTGRWLVGRTFRGLAVIGNGEIDLRQAHFINGETTIHATAIIGTITVVVPETAEVHIDGTNILGTFPHHAEGPGTPNAPKITITGLTFCGTIDVQRRPLNAAPLAPKQKRT
ncbi:DUF1707 SHOCT-like domain-containing protein [Nonomuraea sediminis]|uniref:DUF1707 SHOCT-like domain-containing protein n=1 Tax=Nonomuraea sediminis TaxID=2835864 RepID=UPI001BDC5266|nr:DUF1707 domain-containing protein [Nonomuraea sediminis]